jgi:hypothetical protein
MYKNYPGDFGGVTELEKIFPRINEMPDASDMEAYSKLLELKR